MGIYQRLPEDSRIKTGHATAIDIACRREAGDRNATVPRGGPLVSAPLDTRQVKARADFLAIASRYTKFRRAGRQYVALCPFHSENNPSFYVDPERKIFRCFGRCAAGGDLFDFVMRAEGCNFPRALEIVADFSSGVARSSPRSGEPFGARVEGEALSARAAGGHHSLDSRVSILARLNETERVLAAIRRTNDEHSRSLATACEPAREAPLLETEG